MRIPLTLVALAAVSASMFGCSDPTAIVVEPLRILNWSPSSGAPCVGVDATASATFSDDLAPDSLTAERFYLKSSDGPVEASLSYDKATYTVTLTPAAHLDFDRLYTVVAATGLKSLTQGQLAVDLDASFMTIKRNGCVASPACSLPSDCPGTQICSNVGVCVDECVTDKDCWRGHCSLGKCGAPPAPDGAGGDPAGGDPAGG